MKLKKSKKAAHMWLEETSKWVYIIAIMIGLLAILLYFTRKNIMNLVSRIIFG
ncbi:hypothetical protein HN695_04690 [Candidatus Woesearchaeota archaeon]|jgi:hypothetical protein|nr:hypothetical protein [Candidatus Woesearchaeota archaeon]MBT5271874.1 hypothetical protein [Candidatus Woesearchaeota archaeon]MBT6041662.1 hypothetical protein [Candidatus Woesearchaeota archaeon]MBT6337362.1 hypothetical protein [Candidatus Woesearchaeota archaeon]MBT7927610.1 hypothetical protein [Candidatus Woesearchaeota archaeon]